MANRFKIDALLNAVGGGKGFVGIYGATATFWNSPAYLQMIGGKFLVQIRTAKVTIPHPMTEDVVARMETLNGGEGPDVVFDCAGVGGTLDQAFNMVRRQGQVMLVAVPWEPMPVLPVDWMAREVKLLTTFGAMTEDLQISMELLRTGKVSLEYMVLEAEYIPLDDIQQAFEALLKPSTQLQMVIRF